MTLPVVPLVISSSQSVEKSKTWTLKLQAVIKRMQFHRTEVSVGPPETINRWEGSQRAWNLLLNEQIQKQIRWLICFDFVRTTMRNYWNRFFSADIWCIWIPPSGGKMSGHVWPIQKLVKMYGPQHEDKKGSVMGSGFCCEWMRVRVVLLWSGCQCLCLCVCVCLCVRVCCVCAFVCAVLQTFLIFRWLFNDCLVIFCDVSFFVGFGDLLMTDFRF